MSKEEVFRLKQELNKLLRERPELVPLQRKIDEVMRNAGSQHNRLILIKHLMMESVADLNNALKELLISTEKVKAALIDKQKLLDKKPTE